MFGSLRFRLPALFLLGIVLAGLVASLISIRFFQSYTRARAIDELRSESVGIVQLYAQQAGVARRCRTQRARRRDRRRPDLLGAGVSGLAALPARSRSCRRATLDIKQLKPNGFTTVDISYKGKSYLAVAQPLKLGDNLFGALVVAKPTSQLRSRSVTLIERLGHRVRRRHHRRRPARLLSLAADHRAAAQAVARGRRGRGGRSTASSCRARAARTRSRISRARFADMAAKLAESEQLSRNFLMSVSHELRTPLTAIRGHVSALREGVIDDPSMREASLGVIGEEALRLERLVGDVLDLAKLDAHRFTVLQEEVDMERLSERAYAAFGEEARRRDDRLPARRAREAGDRDRRRPRAADHREPALERVPLDAGGRADRARAVGGERVGLGCGRGHGAGHHGGGARAHLPAVLVARRRRHRARARDRARARGRARRADRARQRARSAAAASCLCCRRASG